MNINHIIRVWKDESYRLSLTAAEQALLPVNPAGALELSDAQLGAVSGAAGAVTSAATTIASLCRPLPSLAVACRPLPPIKKLA